MTGEQPTFIYPYRGQRRHIAGPAGFSLCQVRGLEREESIDRTLSLHPSFSPALVAEAHDTMPVCRTCDLAWGSRTSDRGGAHRPANQIRK